MATGRRIDISLFNEELITLINASAKIFPVNYEVVEGNSNPNNYEYVRVIEGEHRNEIYRWEVDHWEIIGADDRNIDWSDIKNKPTSYVPKTHNHGWDDIVDKPSTFPPEVHNHDDNYYTKVEVDDKLSTKSDSNHNHDLEYAEKSVEDVVDNHEIRLSNIENGYTEGHSHNNLEALNQITIEKIEQWDDKQDKLSGDVTSHYHSSDRYTHPTDKQCNYEYVHPPTLQCTHNHNDEYYTESEIDIKLANKADLTTLNGHTGNSTVHVTQSDKDKWNTPVVKVSATQPTDGTEIWYKEV